jgi:hypothetical protein
MEAPPHRYVHVTCMYQNTLATFILAAGAQSRDVERGAGAADSDSRAQHVDDCAGSSKKQSAVSSTSSGMVSDGCASPEGSRGPPRR